MKRILTIMFLILLTFNVGASSVDSSKTPVLDKTEELIDKYGGKLASSFSKAMETATPIAKEGFKIAVKFQIAEGIARLLPILLFIIFITIFNSEYKRIENILQRDDVSRTFNRSKGPFSDDNITPKLILFFIFSIIFFLVSLVVTYGGITRLIAPEWYAMLEILELMK